MLKMEEDTQEVFIEVIRSFPCLWNMAPKEYKDVRLKENAWKAVSQKSGIDIDECKKRWKSLRDKFVRELKLIKKKKVSGTSGPPPTSDWPYFTVMSFIQDTVRHRK